ncbi:hypothetical protein DRJ25_06365 [Candidatus Woesearchaeota archaeon]|nr:MAG: hypothetical protein DRJ25_06365 [Candidatus Woesearchaeota archaeon]
MWSQRLAAKHVHDCPLQRMCCSCCVHPSQCGICTS